MVSQSVPWNDLIRKRAKTGYDARRELKYSRQEMRKMLQKIADGKRLKDLAPGLGITVGGLHHRLSREFYPEIGATNITNAVAIGFREGWLK